MISRQHRFHGHSSLNYLHAHASVVRNSKLLLKYVANSKRQDYRAAIVVSRKVSKSAVTRNRIRRRMYECVRILSSEFTGVYDLAFFVYDVHVADQPQDQLMADIHKLLQKSAIIIGTAPKHAIVDAKES